MFRDANFQDYTNIRDSFILGFFKKIWIDKVTDMWNNSKIQRVQDILGFLLGQSNQHALNTYAESTVCHILKVR